MVDTLYIQPQRMFEKNMSLTAKIFKNYPKYYISISESIPKILMKLWFESKITNITGFEYHLSIN